jgi:uncharacterized cupin superfamily protein
MPKIDLTQVPERKGSGYPLPFRLQSQHRIKQALGSFGGLGDFGVNRVHLPPGEWSSQRHWHTHEEELVYVLSGSLTLVTNEGESLLGPGECAAFPKNTPDGHHFINRGTETAVYLEVGSRHEEDTVHYSDVDLHWAGGAKEFKHKDGTPYPKESPKG